MDSDQYSIFDQDKHNRESQISSIIKQYDHQIDVRIIELIRQIRPDLDTSTDDSS